MDSKEMQTFRQKISKNEWTIKKMSEKDKPTYTSDVYKVFLNVYEKQTDTILNQWFVCSSCGIVIKANLQDQSYKLRRHDCYKKYKKGLNVKEEEDEPTETDHEHVCIFFVTFSYLYDGNI